MRLRIWSALLLIVGVMACATLIPTPTPIHVPGIITIEAQTLPYTIKLAWDINPAADQVTNYNLIVDGVSTPITLTLCSTSGCFTQTDLTTLGVRTRSASRRRISLESPKSQDAQVVR